jgi:ArsR family transcriptional regulator
MQGQLDLFRAMGDPTRLRIVQLLREMELAVGEIAVVVGQSQPRVSRHIRILVDSGLVDRRREGSWVFLTLRRDETERALGALLDVVPRAPSEALWVEADLARLAAVRAERARSAEDYFATHAEQWDAIRSLHAPEADVEQSMSALLEASPLGKLLDIGTGTGRMATLFAGGASSVTAIDRSPDMLRLARAKTPADLGDKVRFMIGDFYSLPVEDATVDTAILHQVLHYAQEPERAIAEVSRVLTEGGRLLIADFAAHEREELRQRDAHARLGFSDAQIEAWYRAVGIELVETRALEGGELTVKLWLGRRHGARVRRLKTS